MPLKILTVTLLSHLTDSVLFYYQWFLKEDRELNYMCLCSSGRMLTYVRCHYVFYDGLFHPVKHIFHKDLNRNGDGVCVSSSNGFPDNLQWLSSPFMSPYWGMKRQEKEGCSTLDWMCTRHFTFIWQQSESVRSQLSSVVPNLSSSYFSKQQVCNHGF